MAIGSMAEDVVRASFAQELLGGNLQWLSLNYDEAEWTFALFRPAEDGRVGHQGR